MRVQFQFNVDDLVDVQLRALKRSRAAKAWLRRDMAVTAIVAGAVLFAIIPGDMIQRFIVGGIGFLLGALLYPLINERTVKGRLRKLYEENAGTDNLFLCEVELKESGVHVYQNDSQIIYSWHNVKDIKETDDSVDIYTQKGGGVVVRNRAFSNPSQRQQFIELAQQYLNQGGESEPPAVAGGPI